MNRYTNLNDLPAVKVAKPVFATELAMIALEEASPYADRLLEVFRRIYESGIWHKWHRCSRYSQSWVLKMKEKVVKNVLVLELILIVSTDCLLGCLSFIFELILHDNRIIIDGG